MRFIRCGIAIWVLLDGSVYVGNVVLIVRHQSCEGFEQQRQIEGQHKRLVPRRETGTNGSLKPKGS